MYLGEFLGAVVVPDLGAQAAHIALEETGQAAGARQETLSS